MSDEGSGDTKDRQTLQGAEIAARETLSPVERLEIALHPWVGFLIIPLFAFANAGLPLSLGDLGNSVTVAVFLGFALGKYHRESRVQLASRALGYCAAPSRS